MDILGVQFGLSISPTELRRKITEQGWRVDEAKFDKARDRYVAKAVSSRGQKIERTGKTERTALANLLLAVTARQGSTRLGRWRTNFTDQLQEIAEAYSKAPSYTARASEPFLALARDCERRAEVLARHLQIEVVNDPEPYKSPDKLVDDVRKRRKLIVSRANSLHPIWHEQQVVAYRICHDVLGYAAANAGWDWDGENEAFAHHVHLLGDQAQLALFTESIAMSAYTTFYHAFGPQKVAVFPQFMNPAMESENPHKGWTGVHPDESHPPIELPSVKPIVSSIDVKPEWPDAKTADVNSGWLDPNHGMVSDPSGATSASGVEPVILPNGQTIRGQYGDPLGVDEGKALAAKLYQPTPGHRPWDQVQDPTLKAQMDQNRVNGGPAFTDTEFNYLKTKLPAEYERMRRAISNAFRAVLTSPNTALHENAVHYQTLSHGPYAVPTGTDDPWKFFRALDTARRQYNVDRWEEDHPGEGEQAPTHLQHAPFIPRFAKYIAQMKQLPAWEAQETSERVINELRLQEEDRLMEDEEKKHPDKQLYQFQFESRAAANVAKVIQALLAAHRKKQDFAVPTGLDPIAEPLQQALAATAIPEGATVEQQPQLPRRYPGMLLQHLVNIARVEPHIDDILKAALEDVHNHDGAGHHFRATVLQFDIPGIGPKVTSFAWLLLKPLTSELATLDFHMMNVMGSSASSPSNRDYFGWERAFRGRLDAMGYQDVPSGLGQWLIWDHERTGGGTHQDHSSFSPIEPTPWSAVDWHPGLKPNPNWSQEQEWWNMTQPLQDQIMEQYDSQLAPKTPQRVYPFQGMPKWGINPTDTNPVSPVFSYRVATRLDSVLGSATPYFSHPWTGERITGQPGETIMGHARRTLGLSVPEIWAQIEDAGKERASAEAPALALQPPVPVGGPLT